MKYNISLFTLLFLIMKTFIIICLLLGVKTFSQPNEEVLNEVVIDLTKTKNNLIQILDKSKKEFQKHEKKNISQFTYCIKDENNINIEEINSFVRYKDLGYVLYGYNFYWIKDQNKLESLQYISSTRHFSFFTDYSLFRNELFYEDLLLLIKNSDLYFKESTYYIYDDNKLATDLIFKVDEKNEILLEFINKNKVLIRENVKKEERQLQYSEVVTKFVFSEDNYAVKEIKVNEQYLVKDQIIKIDFKSNLSEYTKKEIQKMDSKSMLGFVIKYTRKKKEFIKSIN